jgi:hypothetical protein
MNHEARTSKVAARRVVYNRFILAPLALIPLATGLLAASWARSPLGLGLAVFAITVFAGSLVLAAMLIQFPERVAGKLEVGRKVLRWKSRPLFGGAGLRDAVAFTNDDRRGVRVRTAWRTAYFEVASREEADRIVQALGRRGSERADRDPGGGRRRAAGAPGRRGARAPAGRRDGVRVAKVARGARGRGGGR